MKQSYLYLLSVFILFYFSAAEENDSSRDFKIFQKLFQEKRKEQKSAIESLMQSSDYAKQYKMVDLTLNKIFEVLGGSQEFLRKVSYVPGEVFPTDEETRNALAQTLETTCLLGEVVLHLPEITHKILNKLEPIHRTLLAWGVFFTAHSSFLPKTTKTLVHLMTQELGLAEKDPDYINPYAHQKKKQSSSEKSNSSKTKKKKKSFKKGPGLSRQYGDL